MLTHILVTPKMTYAKEQKIRKHECTVCQKRFLNSNDLRKHIRVHTNERPFMCNRCNQSFRQAGSLKSHVASQHNEDSKELYVCNYCQKVFPLKERLRLHIRIHTGDKPYSCDLCPKDLRVVGS